MKGVIYNQLVGNIYSGTDFKKIAAENNWELVKYLPFSDFTETSTKYIFSYKIGINTINEKMWLGYESQDTDYGLHFTCSASRRWRDDYCYWVSIPDDAWVLIEEDNKFKTDKLEILGEVDEQWYMSHVGEHGYWLKHITNQTDDMCSAAIKQNSYALQYVINQTPELCLEAVHKNGLVLRYVKDQTPEICRVAIEQNELALMYMENLTNDTRFDVVKQNLIEKVFIR